MLCYRCNGTVDPSRDTCSKCGTDVRVYKKIVYASNRYYNEGLVKAQARDLTGARDSLRKSLYLYKKNTNARNLLGLVEYAMGESAEALKEWVLSKNLSTSRNANVADRFINSMKRNMRELDSEGHGIRKYNQALNYARNGAKDLAMIQLKKVVSVHSNMTKAYELLALLYIDDGKIEQAKKVIAQCLQVDRGNASALHFMKELENMSDRNSSRSVGVVGETDREQLIIPVRFRDYGSYLSNALYIVLGLIIGIAIAWYVMVPGKVEKEMVGVSDEARSYEQVISDLQGEIAALQLSNVNESEESSIEESSMEQSSEEESRESESSAAAKIEETFPAGIVQTDQWTISQDAVNRAVSAYGVPDYTSVYEAFFEVNPGMLSSVNAEHYKNLIIIVLDEGVKQNAVAQAEEYQSAGENSDAGRLYDAIAMAHRNDPELRMKAAACYEAAGDQETAANRYWQVYNLFPESEYTKTCSEKYMELTGKDHIPGVPEGTDTEALTAPLNAEALEQAIVEEG